MIPFGKLFYRGKDVEKPGEKDIALHGDETGETVRSSWPMTRKRSEIDIGAVLPLSRDRMGGINVVGSWR